MHISIHFFVWKYVYFSWTYAWEMELLSHMTTLSEELTTISHGGCTIWHPLQQHVKIKISPHPHQVLASSFTAATPVGAQWHLIMVLTFISLLWLLAECISSLEKCPFKSFLICEFSYLGLLSC